MRLAAIASDIRRQPPQLRVLLAAAITLLALLITLVVSTTIGRSGVERVQHEIGLSLAMLADQMQDKLDRGLFERVREINSAAEIFAMRDKGQESPSMRRWLELAQSTFPDYAWIGVADTTGKVIASTERQIEGQSVAQEGWFRLALKGPNVGDVHDAGKLFEGLPARPGEPLRFIDVAAPIIVQGRIAGVLGAHLSWSWAQEVQDSLFGSIGTTQHIEVLVINKAGTVLLGPPEIVNKTVSLDSVRAEWKGARRFSVETWPDGIAYLSGYAESDGYRQFGGLGWSILVRQQAREALAPVARLQNQILAWSAVFVALSALLAWFLAGRLANPLLKLATAADQLRRGGAAQIPHVGGYAEAEMLSNSLRTLVAELQTRETKLSDLNVSLEQQVADRTRKLEEQNLLLGVAKEAAELATQSKSRFLAAASHDLRQPLHALTLFARALSRRVEGAEAKGLVAQTEQALASLKEMFDALLNVSRLDAGLIKPSFQLVALSTIIERVQAGFKAEAESRGLKFKIRAVDAIVRSDAVLLETIVRNLVSNAFKFTRQGGVLLVCRRLDGRIAIEVYDTGPGIPVASQNRVFQEFERSHSTASGANDGLGLGLSIVLRYAHLLGMTVDLASRLGHGSRFRVLMAEAAGQLPVADSSPRTASRDTSRLTGRRILVLDDERLIVDGLARDLGDRGCTVIRAGSTAEANAAIADGPMPDAAVVDVNLATGETGPAFIDRIERKLGHVLPTLVLTGATDAESLAALMRSGRPWLTKPADPDIIAGVLAELLSKAKAPPH